MVAACGPWGDSTSDVEDLLGAWSGTMTFRGEEQPLALEVEPAEDGQVSLRLTVPAMHLARAPVGSVEPRIEGPEVALGPFSLTYDGEARTLTGTMPDSMVPVYQIPFTLRRVEAVEVPARPEPTAPLAEPVWTFDAGAPLWAGTTFADGVILAGDDAGHLHALDAGSGGERWSFAAGGAIRARATVEDGAVYVQADDGRLFCVDATSGEEIWQVRVSDPVERLPPTDPRSRWDVFGSDVTVAEGALFLGTHDGRLVALKPDDGALLWEYSAGGSVLAAPTVASGRVYFGSFDGHVHALDGATGKPLWKRDTKGAVVSTPALAGEVLVVGNRSYDLLGLNVRTGEPVWTEYIWFSWVESSAKVEDSVAYVGSSDAAAAFAFEASTGKRLWRTDVHGWAWGQPALTDARVFVGTAALRGYSGDAHRGGVFALDRRTGKPTWRWVAEPPEEGVWGFPGSPAAGDGRVFVSGLEGRVLAFRQ
jgi:outer membrane protein assembly factor BamB